MNRRLFFSLIVISVLMISLSSGQGLDRITEEFATKIEIPTTCLPKNPEIQMYIVYGSKLDTFERLILDYLSSDAFSVESEVRLVFKGNKTIKKEIKINKELLSDNETNPEKLKNGATIVILVGGEKHNRIAGQVYEMGYIENESSRLMGNLVIGKGDLDTDSKVMVLYHRIIEGDKKLEREAVNHSPLNAFMPREYIPVAATGIGMFLMSLFNIFKTVAEFLALNIGRKKKRFGHVGPKILGVHVREILAILGAAMVLGFAVTWTFAGPTIRFFDLLFLNTGICLFAALSHELSHRLIGRLFGINIEYRFWYMGSFITILTAFLGNAFGVQGFLMEKVEGDIEKWKYALTKLSAPLVSITITAIFAFMYLSNPEVIFQMIYTTASIWAMAEIIPIRGLDGYDIKNWSRVGWFISFVVISLIFFQVNFIQ